jgi:hypothetical protein
VSEIACFQRSVEDADEDSLSSTEGDPKHIGLALLPDNLLACDRIDNQVQARVRRAENHLALDDRRRADHPAAIVVVAPPLLTGDRIDRIEVRIPATGIHDAVHDCRRRLESDLVVNYRILAAVEPPFLLARRRVDRIEVAVPAADEYGAVGVRRRRVDDVTRREFSISLRR